MPIRLVHNILFNLVESGLVSETTSKDEKELAYQPARDINQLTIQSVIGALEQSGTDTLPVAKTESHEALSEALKNFSDAMQDSPANKLLKDI